MPFPNEHSIRIHAPSGYSRYRRKNLTGGVDAIIGFKKGGGSEIQALRFDKSKFSIDEARAWASKHGYKNPISVTAAKVSSDHISVADVSVRQPVKNVSITYGALYGQAGPGQGMGYIVSRETGPDSLRQTGPAGQVPAGQVGTVRTMPAPTVEDAKWTITNKMGKMDDIHTLENKEQKDLSGITYGNMAPISTRSPMYGIQRSIPSAFSEGDSGLEEDPRLDEIIDLVVDKDIDPDELRMGMDEETEHTKDPMKAAKIALDHLVITPDYYSKLKKVMDHAEHVEVALPSSELKEVTAMGIGIGADKNLTQITPPAFDIKADIKGELAQKRDEPVYTETDDEDEDDLKDGCWVAAFKSGTHVDADGESHKWDPGDMQKIAQQYNKAVDPINPARHIAPIVLGHPEHNSPAYGWIEKAKAVKDKLFVKIGQLQPEFVDALKKGLYKTRSISLYPDLNIRHLGFLGGSVPAVKGLGPYKFSDDVKFQTYEFTEGVDVDVNELKKENSFFKKLFDLFKIEVKEFKEGTSKDIQPATTERKTVETIDNKFPKGATMAEETKIIDAKPGEIQPRDHCRYASDYLAKMKSFIDAGAVTGISGQDISSHKEKAEEFARLAMHHMGAAHKEPPVAPPKDATDLKPEHHMHLAHAAMVAHDHAKVHEHLTAAHAAISQMHAEVPQTATVAGNLTEKSTDHIEPVGTGGTKEIPVTEVKADKDKIADLTAELTKLKDEISRLIAENEKIKNAMADKQKEDAMGSYKEFCDHLVTEGRMRPADLEQTVLNLKARAEMDKVNNFSEADEDKSFLNQYKVFLSAMPKVVEFNELITGKVPEVQPAANFVEEEIAKLLKAEPKLPYHEALNRIGQAHPDKVREYVESGYQQLK